MNILTTIFLSFFITSFTFLIWNHVNFMFDCIIQKEWVTKEHYLLDALMEYATDYYKSNFQEIRADKAINVKPWPIGQKDSDYRGLLLYNIQDDKVLIRVELLKEGCNPKILSKTIKL